MFHYGLPSFLKQSAHADDRLAERTNVPQSVLDQLRRDIKKSPIPHGDHHVTLEDGSFAVLKDVGRGGEKRHVVATVLSPSMSPPGTDVTEAVSRETPNTRSAVYTSAGPRAQQRGGSHIEQKVYRDRGTLSAQEGHERSERLRDRIRNVRARSESRVSRAPGSFSESHSYSSVEKVAFTGALIGGAVAGGDAKQRAVGAAGGQIGSATIGNLAMAGGLYAAHKAGYTQPLLKDTAWGTFKNVVSSPVQSVKTLGARGGAFVAVPTILGTVGGAYAGSKMAVNKYKSMRARRTDASIEKSARVNNLSGAGYREYGDPRKDLREYLEKKSKEPKTGKILSTLAGTAIGAAPGLLGYAATGKAAILGPTAGLSLMGGAIGYGLGHGDSREIDDARRALAGDTDKELLRRIALRRGYNKVHKLH